MANIWIRRARLASPRVTLSADSSARIFLALLIFASATASLLRFWNLENRVLLADESISVLRAAGFVEDDFSKKFSDGNVHAVVQMRVYQGAGSPKPPVDVVRSLVLEDPQHPPIFYLLLHSWQRIAGASILLQRLLPTFIGIASIPAMYWLCLELFRSRRTALIGSTLLAVSPFFFAYSHQLREYGLLGLCGIVAQALLLRAERAPRPLIWTLYALSLSIGLYSDLFFVLLLVAHAAYLLLPGHDKRITRNGITALLAATALYLPWIAALVLQSATVESTNSWSTGNWPIGMLFQKWIFNAGTTFFDLEYKRMWLSIFLAPIFAAMLYAFFYIGTKAPALQRRAIGCLLLSTVVLYGCSDVISHAHRSANTRYGTLAYLTLLLCMTAVLGYETSAQRRRGIGRAATLGIVAVGLASCIAASRQPAWWDNHVDDEIPPIAERIDSAEHPYVIAPTSWLRVFLLSFRLRNDVQILFPRNGLLGLRPGVTPFMVATQNDAGPFVRAHSDALFQPLYTAHDSTAWKGFHRRLTPGQFIDAGAGKLSLWRIADRSGVKGPSQRGVTYTFRGCVVYGPNDWFTTNLVTGGSRYASNTVDPRSANIISNIVSAFGRVVLHINASDSSVRLQVAPVNVARGNTPLYSVRGLRSFANSRWNDNPQKQIPWESSFYSQGTCRTYGGDCHSIVVTVPAGYPRGTHACIDYETYTSGGYSFNPGTRTFSAAAFVVHNLKHAYNGQIQDAAGVTEANLPLLGTAEIGEDAALPSINHIAYMVLPGSGGSAKGSNGYVAPATQGAHCASSCTNAIPMGARLRLNPSKYTCPSASTNPQAHKICVQLETYGMIVMDHGAPDGTFDIPVGPTSDNGNPWDSNDIGAISSTSGHGIPLQAFDVMRLGQIKY